jgi:ADP-ribose pyrophosphatase YjhB (NUDIX family)
MISFVRDHHRFQLRAAAIVTHENYVLLHRLAGDQFWALPGGRVEMGEDGAAAVRRELKEELDVAAQCGQLLYVVENFFTAREEQLHEVGLYYSATLPQGSKVLDIAETHSGVEGNRSLEFRWFSFADLSQLDLRPAFLKQALLASGKATVHVVHHQ